MCIKTRADLQLPPTPSHISPCSSACSAESPQKNEAIWKVKENLSPAAQLLCSEESGGFSSARFRRSGSPFASCGWRFLGGKLLPGVWCLLARGAAHELISLNRLNKQDCVWVNCHRFCCSLLLIYLGAWPRSRCERQHHHLPPRPHCVWLYPPSSSSSPPTPFSFFFFLLIFFFSLWLSK